MPTSYVNGTANYTASATSLTGFLQSRSPNNLLVAVIGVATITTVSTPSGWTKVNQTSAGAAFSVSVYWRLTDNAEADPSFTWTGAAEALVTVYKIIGNKATSPIGAVGAVGSGVINPHTSSSLTTTATNSFVILVDFANAASGDVSPGAPWATELQYDQGNVTTFIGSQTIAASGGTSGAVSQTSAAAAWVQQQIEILDDALQAQACL